MRYLSMGECDEGGLENERSFKRSIKFVLSNVELYERTFEGVMLKYLDEDEARYVMRETHEGSCGDHFMGSTTPLASRVIG